MAEGYVETADLFTDVFSFTRYLGGKRRNTVKKEKETKTFGCPLFSWVTG